MCVIFAKDQGREARIVGDQVVISGLKYNFASLDKLPEQISLEKVFTRTDDHYVYFQSEFSPHSSFAKVKFNYTNNQHTSAEQAFCFQKAAGNNMHDLAKSVLTIDDPRKCKALVANIKTTEQWQKRGESWNGPDSQGQIPSSGIQEKKWSKLATEGLSSVLETRNGVRTQPYDLSSLKTERGTGKNQLGAILDCEKARILQEFQGDADPHNPAENEVETEHATPPKEAAKPKKDKKKSPKERRNSSKARTSEAGGGNH